jgi:hypothetical protein
MPVSLYDASVPVMINGLKAMNTVLQRGAEFAATQGIDEAELVGKRLWPDMMSLGSQIQRASDTAKFTAVRVGQAQTVPMEDNETTFAQLRARVDATIAFLEGVDPKGYEDREEADLVVPVRPPVQLKGKAYILDFAVPNFWFHITTAYDILRSAGVPIGKRNYLGWE